MARTLGSSLVCCLLGPGVLGAESPRSPGDQPIGPSHFDHLDNSDGLSQVSVSAMLQDHRGFLWFGTSDGLNRYDGYEFKIFYHEPDDPSSLSHRRVRALFEDRDGSLWIGTDGGGLNLLKQDGSTFVHSRHDPENPQSLSNDHVLAITQDSAGSIWVGTRHGLNRLESRNPWRFTRFPLRDSASETLGQPRINSLLEDLDGSLWSGSAMGLDVLDASRQNLQRFPLQVPGQSTPTRSGVHTLLQTAEGTLWVGTDGGLFSIQRSLPQATGRTAPIVELHQPAVESPDSTANDIRGLAEEGQGKIWVATQGGLFLFDPDGGTFQPVDFDQDRSPAKEAIASITVDRTQALWLGTWISGVYYYDSQPGRFAHFHHDPDDPSSLFYDTVYAFEQDPSGQLWVGTVGGGINRYDATTRSFDHFLDVPSPETGRPNSVRCLESDAEGNLWVGTRESGLIRFDTREESYVRYNQDEQDPTSLISDQILSLKQDGSGDLWIGTMAGLAQYDPASDGFEFHDLPALTQSSLGPYPVMTITEDRASNLWMGTLKGLVRYDRRKAKLYTHREQDPTSLSHNHVWSILEDASGILWIGTGGGGLNRLDPRTETFRHFTAADGLGNNNVYGIQQDDAGRLWISTNRGLVRFTPETDHWIAYDLADGLQGIEFNVGAAYRGRDGTMYFGGVRGFNAFDPGRFKDSPHIPPVELTSFEVLVKGDHVPRPVEAHIELNHLETFFSFEFAALNYTRPDKNRYAYYLEGLEEGWVEADTRRVASYTNVPAGSYTFRVKGSNNDGRWNEEGTSVTVIVTPPWWRSRWAHAGYVLAVLGILAGFVGSQRQKLRRERAIAEHQRTISADLEAKNAELERFAYTVSHDLKNPLVTIRNYVGVVRQGLPPDSDDRLVKDLGRIDRASARMHRMIEELLELSRIGRIVYPPEEVQISHLAAEAVEQLCQRVDCSGTELHIAPDLPAVQVDRLRLQEALLNLFENAFKFMGNQTERRIDLGLRNTEDGFGTFFVRDNGIGIDPSHLQRVFGLFERLEQDIPGTGVGLTLVQRIIEAHGGEIWAESAGANLGTTFCFVLPLSSSQDP